MLPPPLGSTGTDSPPGPTDPVVRPGPFLLSGEAAVVWRVATARANASRCQRPCNECVSLLLFPIVQGGPTECYSEN